MYDEPNTNPVNRSAPSAPLLTESWRRCCDRLRAELGDDIFNSWFVRIALESVSSGQALLSVPTRFLKSWIDTHYAGHIGAALTAEVGPTARVNVFVRSSMRPESPANLVQDRAVAQVKPLSEPLRDLDRASPPSRRLAMRSAPTASLGDALAGSPLDRRLTFSTFQ